MFAYNHSFNQFHIDIDMIDWRISLKWIHNAFQFKNIIIDSIRLDLVVLIDDSLLFISYQIALWNWFA